jgi:hypothetical protein
VLHPIERVEHDREDVDRAVAHGPYARLGSETRLPLEGGEILERPRPERIGVRTKIPRRLGVDEVVAELGRQALGDVNGRPGGVSMQPTT